MRKRKPKNRIPSSEAIEQPVQVPNESQKRRQEWFIILLLLAFGIYQSILFYQYKQVPNVDFAAFVKTANALLHFQLPGNFKRVPMLGLLQIGLSQFCPGAHPILTAGWLLNGIFHALSVVLLYRIGKHFLGQNAFFFALLAGINPWMLQMTTDPIAETTLIFFMLLTFDCILRRSWWCYLFAMAACMTRYEGGGLIVVAFVIDMILRDRWKDRIRALIFASLAMLPVLIWLVLWRCCKPETGHYTGHFIHTKTRAGLTYWNLLWDTTFGPLFQVPAWVSAVFGQLQITGSQQADEIRHTVKLLGYAVRIVTGAGFLAALVVAAIRKNWKFWSLFGFWGMYVGLHTFRHVTLDRYTIPAIWMTGLIVFYGFQAGWELIAKKWTVPGWLKAGFLIVVGALSAIWIFRLGTVLPATAAVSRRPCSLVYVSIGVLVVYLIVQWWTKRNRHLLKLTACLLVCSLALMGNQFKVTQLLGNGMLDAEFKMLASWYLEHAEPGDKMLTSMTDVVKLFVPEHKKNIGPIAGPEKTIQEFVQSCYKRNIKYVVWDSRQGLTPNDSYYKQGNLQKIAPLSKPRDIGPFKYRDKIVISQRRYLYIFELQPLSEFQDQQY